MMIYKFLEGITSLGMPFGYLIGGGGWTDFLFMFYLVHFAASFVYHLFPSKTTYMLDVLFINLITMERIYLINGNLWCYVFYLLSMFFEQEVSHITTMMRVFVSIITFCSDVSFFYYYLWVSVAIFYKLSCDFKNIEELLLSSLFCCLYHIILGMVSFIEIEMYVEKITNTTNGFLRFCFYFLFVAYVMTRFTKESRRLRSVLSFLTALILSPLSFYQTWKLLHNENGGVNLESFILNFYLAYVVVDTIVGYIFYRDYFSLLEGWLHHFGTFGFIYYFSLNPVKKSFCCSYMMVEFPTIVLCLSRIFYDVEWIQNIKKKIFYPLFFVFRILVPNFLVFYFFDCDVYDIVIHLCFTSLNAYWFLKMTFLKKKKI